LCGSADLQIPLKLKGTTSYFVTRLPTQQEMDDERNCPRTVMTYESPDWDPGDTQLEDTEDKLRQKLGLSNDYRSGNQLHLFQRK
jgi:hypothetical protein